MKAIRRFSVRTVLPQPIGELGELASNLRWCWHPATRDLFSEIDPKRWAQVHKEPAKMLSALSADELDALACDDTFVAKVSAAARDLATYLSEPRWYQSWAAEVEGGAPGSIAYFSPEYGITAALPQYSGGLGILAGDHLKSASDLGVPIVGVGLFYKTGYFKQSLNLDGWQQETYPVLDPDDLPLALLREPDGAPSIILLDLPGGRVLHAQVWKAQVGRVPLLLLDSDVPDNDSAAREITDRLYGGTGELRLQQELLLGVGGVRALRLWSRLTGAPAPDVFHTNEGHAGFLGIERIRELTTATTAGPTTDEAPDPLTFDEALEAVRAGTVFTTHTPVPAGIDRFTADHIRRYFGADSGTHDSDTRDSDTRDSDTKDSGIGGVPIGKLLALGAEDYPGGEAGMFNMAVMGLRLAQRANGVSQLHGAVSRQMFEGLWPGFDDTEIPITSITNGVHAWSWVDRRVNELAAKHLGVTDVDEHDAWGGIADIPGNEIWATKRAMRERLVIEARRRMRASWLRRGASPAELRWVQDIFDPDVLTIGFARRVPTYKRLTLMLRDPVRLKRILLDPKRPVQLVIAGKSHPHDETGKKLIQQLVRFADDPQVRHRIAFLPNYDIEMAQYLYPGCDVWLNNPLRPFEACGTSGMKAALNGGLNLSILDGWWDEWYDGENGWAIPTADGVEDPDRRDDLEAAALYDLIEGSVAPLFYEVDADGLPQRWVSMIRHTLSTLGPKVLASRQVRDYTMLLYGPAARAVWALGGPDWAGARDLAAYKSRLRAAWPAIRVDHVESTGVSDTPQVGDSFHVDAFVSLDGLGPDEVEVQLVHGRVSEADDLRDIETAPLAFAESYEGGRHRFEGDLLPTRTGAFGYTVRIVPTHPAMANAAELGLVANA